MNRIPSRLILVSVLWALCAALAFAAETSQTFWFNGCDTSLSQDVTLRLRVFNGVNAGSLLFEETQTVTADDAGCFRILLGDASGGIPADIFVNNASLWIAFALDSAPDTELGGGRTAIYGNGYAFRAYNADLAAQATQATTALSAQTAVTFNPGASVSGSSSGNILLLENSGAGPALDGRSAGAIGLRGASSGGLGQSAGVYGVSTSAGGNGVIGEANNGLSAYGVLGRSTSGIGVYGQSTATNGRGVIGESNTGNGAIGVWGKSTGGTGVYGQSNAGGGSLAGVYGLSLSSSGNGVIGEANGGSSAYGVWGKTDMGLGVRGDATSGTGVVGGSTSGPGVWGSSTSGPGVRGGSTSSLGVWGDSSSGDGVRGSAYAVNKSGVIGVNDTAGGFGVTGASRNGIGVWGTSTAATNGRGVVGQATGGTGSMGVQGISDAAGTFAVWGGSTNGFAGYFQGRVQVTSTMTARVVQITGGSDLSEKFAVRDTHKGIEPGMVVAIDPKHPGKLTISAEPYNRKVAGVISGAGGVNPGLLMGQSGSVADGEHPVALTGRVYVWADASKNPIKPGDLLTTSDTPGHAMKVTNYIKAQGAIVGKAMTGLKQGKGLILVLVTLQ